MSQVSKHSAFKLDTISCYPFWYFAYWIFSRVSTLPVAVLGGVMVVIVAAVAAVLCRRYLFQLHSIAFFILLFSAIYGIYKVGDVMVYNKRYTSIMITNCVYMP